MESIITLAEILAGLEKPDKSRIGLARALGRAPPAVTNMLKGKRKISAYEVPIIRKYLELEPMVPIVGYVGASSEEVYYEAGDSPAESIKAQVEITPKMVAVEIRGDSLGPGLNGWLAFYDDVRAPITHDLLGHLCIVGLADGRVLIKTPRKAHQTGRYHLFPNAGSDVIPDAKVRWAARVELLRKRR